MIASESQASRFGLTAPVLELISMSLELASRGPGWMRALRHPAELGGSQLLWHERAFESLAVVVGHGQATSVQTLLPEVEGIEGQS